VNDGQGDTANLYAWIATDPAGIEGIIAVDTPSGILPLVVTDRGTAERFAEAARRAAVARRATARLVRFDRGETLSEVRP
jgi:hypothetical protein